MAGPRGDDPDVVASWSAFITGTSTDPPANGLADLLAETAGGEIPIFRPAARAVLASTCSCTAGTNGRDWLVLICGPGRSEAVHLRLPTDRYEYAYYHPGAGRWTERQRMIVADTVHLAIPPFDGAVLLWFRPVRDPPADSRRT